MLIIFIILPLLIATATAQQILPAADQSAFNAIGRVNIAGYKSRSMCTGTLIASDKTVIADICVDPAENVFPMIPSGAAHNDMLLGTEDKQSDSVSKDGMVLV